MISVDVLIIMIPLCVFSAIRYGFRPALMILAGVASAMLCELFACFIMRRSPTLYDGSAAVTGAVIGAVMSPMTAYWVPMLGAAFAILVVKIPLGGNGRCPFNPAAAGLAILTLCFSHRLFMYPHHRLDVMLPLSPGTADVFTESSLASLLMTGGKPMYDPGSLFIGDFAGPIGATAIAVLLPMFLYLVARRSASFSITVSYLATCLVLALAFPRTEPGIGGALVELCSGYLLFCGVFLINDLSTAPKYWVARILYGACAGALVILLRHSGQFQEGACFAVLIVNAFSSLFDRICWYAVGFRRKVQE